MDETARYNKERWEALARTNALQWRLQYGRAISTVGTIEGVEDLLE